MNGNLLNFWILIVLALSIYTLVGSYTVRYYRPYGFAVLAGFLAIYVTGANILVPRLVDINLFGLSFVLVTGSIIWPFTAQIADMINEIYGKRSAFVAAGIAYGANLMFVLFVYLSFQIAPLWSPEHEAFFREYFGVAGRILIASMSSYSLATYADITVFAKLKRWTYHKEKSTGNLLLYSAIRSGGTDGLNMVVDNLVFYTIAFAGVLPWNTLGTIMVSSLIAKVILSQINLPNYWVFRLLTRNVVRDF